MVITLAGRRQRPQIATDRNIRKHFIFGLLTDIALNHYDRALICQRVRRKPVHFGIEIDTDIFPDIVKNLVTKPRIKALTGAFRPHRPKVYVEIPGG